MASECIQRRIDRLLDEADEAVSRFDWEAVRQRAEAVPAFDADNQEARAFLSAAEASLEGSALSALHESGISAESPKPSSDSPTSFANGRYQVKDFLGEGGKKRVYLSHDSVLDRDVALAVIKTGGLDPTSRIRITREAQAMGRLGDHPNVLSIHDLGEDNGLQYMVLPLMPGGDVEAVLEAPEDHKPPLEQAIDLAFCCNRWDYRDQGGRE